MTRSKISVGRRWIPRLFPGWSGPEEVDDVVTMTTPWEGSGRYADLIHLFLNDDNQTLIGTVAVPDDRQQWVPYAECFHNDPALTSHMWMTIRDRAGKDVAITGAGDVTADRHISIRRPLIITEGGRLVAHLASATAVGKTLNIKLLYVEMPIGEFVPSL